MGTSRGNVWTQCCPGYIASITVGCYCISLFHRLHIIRSNEVENRIVFISLATATRLNLKALRPIGLGLMPNIAIVVYTSLYVYKVRAQTLWGEGEGLAR